MLFFASCLAILATLLQGILIPGFSLCPIAPWIALVLLKKSPIQTLWLVPCGALVLDLLSDHPFGVHALATPGIESLEITAKQGQKLVPLPEGSSYLGFLFARSPSPDRVETALHGVLREGVQVTPDLGGTVGTSGMAEAIVARM